MNALKTQMTHRMSTRQIMAMLLPLMAEQLLITMMGMVNTVMVTHVGPAAISAVSLVDSINVLVIQAFYAMGAGGTIVCAQYLGHQETENANRAARQTLLVITFLSAVIMLLCIVRNRSMLSLIFGAVEEEVLDAAEVYFFFSALSYPFIALYDSGSSIFRAQGQTRFPMLMSALANVFNIIGNVVLVLWLQMGVAGAAISTLAARAFCALVVMWRLAHPKGIQPIVVKEYRKIRPQMSLIRNILRIGIPSGIENGMFQFGKLAIQSTISTLGTTAMAAQAMANTFENLNGVAAVGTGIGLMTVVGQCMGAGEKEEAVYYVKKFALIAEIALIISCLAMYLAARPTAILSGMTPESMEQFLHVMLLISIVKPIFWVPSFVFTYGLRAAGDVKFAMIVSCLTMWLFRVTLTIFLCNVMHMGIVAAWIGMFSDWGVRAIIFTKRFVSKKWLNYSVIGRK